ncbi:[acyl-carrier-protein] S-malonyltransferase [Dickeya undicola]|uniref:[acyl-carrier-protein] S-malonyltransferase n=1 Tax=Dickeya undicola TaxID=1577887 RepID=A0ABX9WWV4_9GAMM|nr:ACP S-malonyltransferase [Dickeya undicola]RNM26551.1 [acyl-carrier-protein] S-malonyltransferase [Dickeya undicola]
MSSSIWVFPGQGSQRKGMGDGLFERFPEHVREADDVLGFSIRELCINDPQGVLGETEFTQPALFVVSALGVLAQRQDGADAPDCYAGHSLGEFVALFAAGAFDFATGVALVRERGMLMSKAPHGAMAAILGLDVNQVTALLASSPFSGIDIANINCAQQIVISGLYDDIIACESLFTDAGARYIKLNVSAAFHSRYMRDIEARFAQFAQRFTFNPLQARVISNYTAHDYPASDYLELLTRQISHPVRWYESMSRLLASGEVNQHEIGPGQVLTSLFAKISAQPMSVVEEKAAAVTPVADAAVAPSSNPGVVFMFGGQGSQYYGMGQALYRQNDAFRRQMDICDALCRQHTGHSLLDTLYDDAHRYLPLSDVALSNVALLSVGVSLTHMLKADGVKPDAVLGYSLGECIAAVVAGVLTLDDAMKLVVSQAHLLRDKTAGGGMMSVLAPVSHFHANTALYQGTELASINFQNNFVVSGDRASLSALKARLTQQDIISMLLPVEQPFHSSGIAAIETDFRALVDTLPKHTPDMTVYSSLLGAPVERWDSEYFWRVLREPVDFYRLMQTLDTQCDAFFVDLSPTGTLSTFIKYGFAARIQHGAVINQFGRNAESVSSLLNALKNHSRHAVTEDA